MLGDVIHSTPVRRRDRSKSSLFARCARQTLTALAAFLVGTVVLGQLIPSPTIPSNIVFIGPKYDYYQQHKDEYNTLFFGSSRVYNQIVPDVFDAEAKAIGETVDGTAVNGTAVNSYNFGVPAMRALDSTVLLEDVLADPPQDLKWVFFETILDKGYEPIPNARTHRAMYWHTWENTGFAARYILTSEEPLPNKAVLLVSHLLPAIYRQLNVGRLFTQVLPSTFSEQEQAVAKSFTANDGYYALTGENEPKRLHFLNNQDAYLRAVQKLKDTVSSMATPRLADNKKMLLNRVTQAVRAAGAVPIFIEPPTLDPSLDFRAAKQLGVIDTLLTYKDPEQHTNLYQPSWRYDQEHLTESASREFSRILARDFVSTISSN
ncbi:MAG: hypothetical protein AAF716_23295 [Cyanobacteria bacterium P01_D01_bin.1]